ncbi:MAG: c-type cytochrome [Chitinophagaceae bacterium]|nr:c-type cytochrome [Chitinophagaceae bacterium]
MEPEKPKQETPPKTVEVPKPVTVVNAPDEPNDWVVLAKYKNMTNPFPVDKENLDLGKSLYGTHCKSCHGAKGDGKRSQSRNP